MRRNVLNMLRYVQVTLFINYYDQVEHNDTEKGRKVNGRGQGLWSEIEESTVKQT